MSPVADRLTNYGTFLAPFSMLYGWTPLAFAVVLLVVGHWFHRRECQGLCPRCWEEFMPWPGYDWIDEHLDWYPDTP